MTVIDFLIGAVFFLVLCFGAYCVISARKLVGLRALAYLNMFFGLVFVLMMLGQDVFKSEILSSYLTLFLGFGGGIVALMLFYAFFRPLYRLALLWMFLGYLLPLLGLVFLVHYFF